MYVIYFIYYLTYRISYNYYVYNIIIYVGCCEASGATSELNSLKERKKSSDYKRMYNVESIKAR